MTPVCSKGDTALLKGYNTGLLKGQHRSARRMTPVCSKDNTGLLKERHRSVQRATPVCSKGDTGLFEGRHRSAQRTTLVCLKDDTSLLKGRHCSAQRMIPGSLLLYCVNVKLGEDLGVRLDFMCFVAVMEIEQSQICWITTWNRCPPHSKVSAAKCPSLNAVTAL